jgi:hypothetical protein
LKHGDFTGLAGDYAKFRPGYAPQVATAILGYVGRDAANIDAADIGAGTGIWLASLLYLEGRHSVHRTPAQYIRAWRLVNDVRVQLGPTLFQKFLDFTEKRVAGLTTIE